MSGFQFDGSELVVHTEDGETVPIGELESLSISLERWEEIDGSTIPTTTTRKWEDRGI